MSKDTLNLGKKIQVFNRNIFYYFSYPLVLETLIMNLNKVSAGILVMVSLAITALPASASPYRTSNNIGQRNKVVNVVKSRNVVNVQRRNNQNQFKKVCTTKRVRVR